MSYNFPSKLAMIIMVLVVLAMSIAMVQGQGTRVGFYSSTCPKVESIVQLTVKSHFQSNSTVAPGLLRMHFHDCFVQGCDGSILIDGSDTEKTARPNGNLRGYEVIDDAKKQLEAVCPGIVSCADILALAARDSVVLTNGASWVVPTGRRDGIVSSASDVNNIPSPSDSVDSQKKKFVAKGLNTQDLVTLVGAHTIGTTACGSFSDRLYNFNGTGRPDPSIDATFLAQLQSLCPHDGNPSKRVALDDGSEKIFDNSFFKNLKARRGILLSDQFLWTDNTTNNFVQRFLGLRGGLLGLTFNVEFGKSMVKMSNIDVKTGSDGEIRKICSAFN